MDWLAVFLVAVGLSMDALAVSVAAGACCRPLKALPWRQAAAAGLAFGAFQAVMPVLGWLVGSGAREFVSGVDHWVAFALLAGIGVKMALDSRQARPFDLLDLATLAALALATSVDAFAVGISFSFIGIPVLAAAVVIGLVTLSLSFVGVLVGSRFARLDSRLFGLFGGFVLFGIGLNILVEHLR